MVHRLAIEPPAVAVHSQASKYAAADHFAAGRVGFDLGATARPDGSPILLEALR